MSTPRASLRAQIEALVKRLRAETGSARYGDLFAEAADVLTLLDAEPEQAKTNMRICFVGTCGEPDVNAPDEGTWPTCSKYPPACLKHFELVPPPQRRPRLDAEPEQGWQDMADAAEMLWVVLANVSGGDWTKQTPDWQEAAARWRDNYFEALKRAAPPRPSSPVEEK